MKKYCPLHSFTGKEHEVETCDDCTFANKSFVVTDDHPYLKKGTKVAINVYGELIIETENGMGTVIRNIEVFNPNKFPQFYSEIDTTQT